MHTIRKIAFLFTIFFILILLVTPSAIASVTFGELKGDVQIIPADGTPSHAAEQGAFLNPNDKVQTGEDGSAKIVIENTGEIKLKKETTWSYDQSVSTAEKREFSAYLAIGRLRADVQKLPGGSSFQIKTPTSIAAVRGTSFGLFVYEFAGQVFTQLDVIDNAVQFSNISGDQSYVIEQGNSATGNDSGVITPPQSTGVETEKVLEGDDDSKKNPNGNGPGGGGNDGSNDGSSLNGPNSGGQEVNPMTKDDFATSDFPTLDDMEAMEAPAEMNTMDTMLESFTSADPTSSGMPGTPETSSPSTISGSGGSSVDTQGSQETDTGASTTLTSPTPAASPQ